MENCRLRIIHQHFFCFVFLFFLVTNKTNRQGECVSLSWASLSLVLEFEQIKGVLSDTPLFTHLCVCSPSKLFALLDYTRTSLFLAPASHKSTRLQLIGMRPFPKSTLQTLSLSHPGGIGRAVGVLWDRHKLCEHSCRAILVCLLAQWLRACLLGSLFAADGEHREDEECSVQASWSPGIISSSGDLKCLDVLLIRWRF